MAKHKLYAHSDLQINGKSYLKGEQVGEVDTVLPLDRLQGAFVNASVADGEPDLSEAEQKKLDEKLNPKKTTTPTTGPAVAPAPKG